MHGFVHDLRYAFRSLVRRPGLAAGAIATLALGIGANVAVFSVVDALLLRRLPVRDPSSLVLLTWSAREWPKVVQDLEGSSRKDDASGSTWTASFPYPVFESVSGHARALSRVFAAASNDLLVNVEAAGRGASASTKFVSGNFFDALGVATERGRPLVPADDASGAPPVAVVSRRFWQSGLGSDPDAVGRTIAVNGRSVLVVGVLPARFFGLEPGSAPDLWIPLHTVPALFSDWPAEDGHPFDNPGNWWLEIGGFVSPGASRGSAEAECRGLFDRFLPPSSRADDPGRPRLALRPIARGEDWTRHRLAAPLLILLGLAAVVLGVACTNVAGLLLAKATTRSREMAIRRSLGAGTARLVRQLLVESVMLSVAASAVAFVVAEVLTTSVLAIMASGRQPLVLESPMNGRAFLFGVVAAAVTGILAGLVPAWRASRVELTPALKDGAPMGSAARRGRTPDALIAAQVALALVLVMAASLFSRTLANLKSVDLGFRPDHLILFSVRPGLNGYSGERLNQFYDALRGSLETIPGVRSASLSLHAAVGGGESTTTIDVPGAPRADAHVHVVGEHYFETLGIPIVAGRPLDAHDRSPDAPSVVVNRALARLLFPGANPLGRTISNNPRRPPLTIVGVAGDVRYNRIREAAPPTFYLTFRERPPAPDEMLFQVRTSGDTGPVMAAIRDRVAALDPRLPVVDLQTQSDGIDRALSVERVFAALTGAFGALALVLAAIGLYAALAFSVVRRTREIGVRMALGARGAQVSALVVRDALRPTLVGVASGAASALAVTRVFHSQLFGLSAFDGESLVATVAVLLAAALASAWLPARKASRVDPMTALRAE